MTRPIHYHISAGSSWESIISDAEYWDAEKSVNDFLDMSAMTYNQHDKTARETSENLLYRCVDKKEKLSIVSGHGTALILVWSACTCDFVTCMN